jgi:hypothetical protein
MQFPNPIQQLRVVRHPEYVSGEIREHRSAVAHEKILADRDRRCTRFADARRRINLHGYSVRRSVPRFFHGFVTTRPFPPSGWIE